MRRTIVPRTAASGGALLLLVIAFICCMAHPSASDATETVVISDDFKYVDGQGFYDLNPWWHRDFPNRQGQTAWVEQGRDRLVINCPNNEAYIMYYGNRNNAPILWTDAPAGDYYAETLVSLLVPTDAQIAGLVVYEGPDGACGQFTLGINTWNPNLMTAAFQNIYDWEAPSNKYSPALPREGKVYLRLYRTEEGETDTYKFFYKVRAEDDWTFLASHRYTGAGARIGLFLTTGWARSDDAFFDYFTLVKVSSDPPSPEPIQPGQHSQVEDCPALSGLADGHYDQLFIRGVKDANGGIQLENVLVVNGRIASVGGGTVAYDGTLSELMGDVFQIESGHADGGGLHLTVGFRVPAILGGSNAQFEFLLTPDCVLVPLGAHIEIPGTVNKEAFKIERAYLDILPDEGKFGGGGLFGPGGIGKTFGGWIDFRSGIGPWVDGRRTVDVTKFGVGAGHLAIPIGSTGAFVEYVAAIIENSGGLSDPMNWLASNLVGQFDFVLGRPFEIATQEFYAYVFRGSGGWNIHDGSFDVSGTGKLLGKIETSNAHLRYDPPYSITATGDFDAGIYRGSMTLHQENGRLTGTLNGDISIPGDVPLIGGKSLGGAQATLDELTFRGSVRFPLIPRVPPILLVPGGCSPKPPCVPYPCCDSCRSCWDSWWGDTYCVDYPCNCRTCETCPDPVCWDDQYSPEIPASEYVSFSFSFDAQSGAFSFLDIEKDGWDSPVGAFPATAEEEATRWASLRGEAPDPAAETVPSLEATPVVTRVFTLDRPAAGVFFRAHYTGGTAVDHVAMKVRTPSGAVLDASEGALPLGYPDQAGYSRFHPEAREQIIFVSHPAAGRYKVTVKEDPALGGIKIQALVHNAAPSGRIVSVLPGPGAGQITVAWEDHDLEGGNTVRVYLNHDRVGHDGFHVGTLEAADSTGRFTFDASALNVPAGSYFVTLVVDDGVNEPLFLAADAPITVSPAGRPEAPGHVQFLPGDGRFTVSWSAGAAPEVIGYRVEWTADHEDLGKMDHHAWVPADGGERMATTVHGVANGLPLLVQVVAVASDLHRSAPSELVRLTPRGAGRHPPVIASEPDRDATVGYGYGYLPLLEDADGADTYVWRLASGPDNMTVDESSGLVSWVPGADQAGQHRVMLEVEELLAGESQGPSSTQGFTIHVYPEDDLSGLEHLYHFVSHPAHEVAEGTMYRYQLTVRGPGRDLRYELLAGPEGMSLEAASGLVSWDVPVGARGAWVRLMALADGRHAVEQDFHLFVLREDHFLNKPTHEVSGRVLSLGKDQPVAGVLLTLEGDGNVTWPVGTDGGYSFGDGLPTGDYRVTPSKLDAVGADRAITAWDARKVLRAVAGLVTLTPRQKIAADVDGSDRVSALDASYILRKAKCQICLPFPGAGRVWAFDPERRDYRGLDQDRSDQDFTAILIGDVNGSWEPLDLSASASRESCASTGPATAPAAVGQAPALKGSAKVWLGKAGKDHYGNPVVPVKIKVLKGGLLSGELILAYDREIFETAWVDSGPAAGGAMLVANTGNPGEIHLALAASDPVTEAGELLRVTLKRKGKQTSEPLLRFRDVSLNDGRMRVVR